MESKHLYELYRKDWPFAAMHMLGHYTWSKQREILRSVQENEFTAVRAAHGLSKTYTAAEVAVLFYNLFPGSRVITTAPTYTQVENLLWPEIRNDYRNSRIQLIGDVHNVSIKNENDPKHFALGFSTDKKERAEGQHESFMLFVFDEAKGIEQWLWESVFGAFSGGNENCVRRWLVVSTTDGVLPGTWYEKCFKESSGWNCIHMSAYDSPYVTGEEFMSIEWVNGDPFNFRTVKLPPSKVRAQIANQCYIDRMSDPATGYGEGSYLWNTKVLGNISPMASHGIITNDAVEKMFNNYNDPGFPQPGKKTAGLDPSWGGEDQLVMYKMIGNMVGKPLVVSWRPDADPTSLVIEACNKIENFLGFDKDYEVRVDNGGGGIAFVTELKKRGYNVIPVLNNQKANLNSRYANMASEQWHEASLIAHQIGVAHDEELRLQIISRGWGKQDKQGRLAVEPKDVCKKLLGQSPNHADAFILTVATPPRNRGVIATISSIL